MFERQCRPSSSRVYSLLEAYTTSLVATALLIILMLHGGCGGGAGRSLILATTTSIQDSGLLDRLLPVFEKEYMIGVKVVSVGSGEALEMGRRGDADVLFVHSRDAEEEFVLAGYGLERVGVMHNDFVLVGPRADPAGTKGEKRVVDAFEKIAAAGSTFVSRDDGSGTSLAELALWEEAGLDPSGEPWYRQTGQGMAETLTVASEMQAYTLSDRATYLSKGNALELDILVEGGEALLNEYSAIVVNPGRHPGMGLNVEGAGDFVEFLTGEKAQRIIGAYRKNGMVLFHPDAERKTRGTGDRK